MSVWSRIAQMLSALASGEGLSALLERLRTPPEQSVAFTIAVIALGAKMAKADGRVTRDEVAAFREVFHIPPEEEAHAARVFDLARQDVAGFDAYAARVARMFGPGHAALVDLMDGLFHIALADGSYHPRRTTSSPASPAPSACRRARSARCGRPTSQGGSPTPGRCWASIPGRASTRPAAPGGRWCGRPIPTA